MSCGGLRFLVLDIPHLCIRKHYAGVFDSTRSGIDGLKVVERAPLKLKLGEALNLRVFVDKSIVEIYANDRQAICRRVYPGKKDSLRVSLFAEDGKAKFKKIKVWEMMPSNPY